MKERPLFRRRRVLRNAYRPGALRWRHRRLRGPQARQRGAAPHARTQPRHFPRAGRGGHARPGQGQRPPLPECCRICRRPAQGGRAPPGAALSPIRSRERSRNAQREGDARQAVRRKRRLRRASFFAAIGVGVAIIGVLIWYFAAVHNMGASPWPSARRRPLPWTPLPGAVLCPSSSALTARNTRKGWSWNSPSPSGEKRRLGTQITITVSAGSQWVLLEDMTGWTLNRSMRS